VNREVELIKEAVDRLLECELAEENGWTQQDIETLERVSSSQFKVQFIEE